MSNGNNGNGSSASTKRQHLSALASVFAVVAAFALIAAITGVAYLGLQNQRQGDQIEKVLLVTKQQNDDIERLLVETKAQATRNGDASELLVDCTTKGGECFARQQEQFTKFFDAISAARQETIVSAFVCNDMPGSQRVSPLTACIERLLDREPK